MFIISESTVSDIPFIRKIAHETWWSTYDTILTKEQISYMLKTIYAPERLTAELTDGSQTYLLLKDEDGLQAFASFAIRTDDFTVCKLHKLYVIPGKQEMGYGRALILDVLDRVRQKEVHTMDLNVNRFNPALHFYQKMGFRILREEDVPVGPYWMNDYVLRLEFDATY